MFGGGTGQRFFVGICLEQARLHVCRGGHAGKQRRWYLDNNKLRCQRQYASRICPFDLHPIAVSEEPTITDDTGQFPIIDSVINWARDFGEDAAEFLQQFWDSAWRRADHRYDDFWSFWDWVSSGIISGIGNSAEARAELMQSDPTLYNMLTG